MRSATGSVLVFVVGAVAAQLALFGGYLDYVKPGQGPWLAAGGVALTVLGLVGMLGTLRAADAPAHDPAHDPVEAPRAVHTHGPLAAAPAEVARARRERRAARALDHDRVPPVALLLVLPVVIALGVSPPPLGAFTAARSGAAVPAPVVHRGFPPLPAGDPRPLAVHDYAERAAWDQGRTLAHRTVTLVGFATPDGDARWYLTRILITCCAADSRSYLVAVDGGGRPPVANTWLRVTGTWTPSAPTADGAPTARIAATAVAPVAAPVEPYELPDPAR